MKKKFYHLTIIYKPLINIENYEEEREMMEEDDKLRIFGQKFVKRNKNKIKIIYKNKEYDLKEYLEDIDDKYNNLDYIKLKLRFIHNIINISEMFKDSDKLLSISENINKIIENQNIESNNRTLISFSEEHKEISFINIDTNHIYGDNGHKLSTISLIKNKECLDNYNSVLKNINKVMFATIIITNMSNAFSQCSSLISLPDLSKWNTTNVNEMRDIFHGCSSLIYLPNISKWDTSNVKNMSSIFSSCSSLISLPDISKWDTSNVSDMSYIFNDCSSLIYLPEISKWNISNVNNISGIFSKCSSLISLPDISKWNTSNVKNMSYIFNDCSSLIYLPEISKWNTSNVNYMNGLFSGCSSLISLPNLSKWNISKVDNFRDIFHGCSSLISLPDIIKWHTCQHDFLGCFNILIINRKVFVFEKFNE